MIVLFLISIFFMSWMLKLQVWRAHSVQGFVGAALLFGLFTAGAAIGLLETIHWALGR